MNVFCDSNEVIRRFERYVTDVRRLLIFHGVPCGEAEHFCDLGLKLDQSKALREDLPALLRNVRDLERERISADEMLTVVALASGGQELVDGRAGSIGLMRTVTLLRMMLAGVGTWAEAHPAERDERPVAAGSAHHDAGSPGGHIALELAVEELRAQLGEVSRRVGELEPRSVHEHAIAGERTAADARGGTELREFLQSEEAVRSLARQEEGEEHASSEREIDQSAMTTPTEWQTESTGRVMRYHDAPEANTGAWLQDEGNAAAAAESVRSERSVGSLDLPGANVRPPWYGYEASRRTGRRWRESSARSVWRRRPFGVVAAVGLVALGVYGSARWVPLGAARHQVVQARSGAEAQARNRPGENGTAKLDGPRLWPPVPETRGTEAGGTHPNEPTVSTPATGGSAGRVLAEREQLAPSPVRVERLPRPRADAEAAGPVADGGLRLATVASARKPQSEPLNEAEREASRPSAARREGRFVFVPPAEMEKHLLASRRLVLPGVGDGEHAAGKVVLNAFIAADGRVNRTDLVEGPPWLVKPAMAAVSWRRYRPYLLQGKPVSVVTPVTLTYPPQP